MALAAALILPILTDDVPYTPVIVVLLMIVAIIVWQHGEIASHLKDPQERAETADLLWRERGAGGAEGRTHFQDRYHRRLGKALRLIDRWFTDPRVLDPNSPHFRPRTSAARAWSEVLLDRCLLLAVAYPILSLLAAWIAGGAAVLGSAEFMPPGSLVERLVFAGLILNALWWWFQNILPAGLTWEPARQAGSIGPIGAVWLRMVGSLLPISILTLLYAGTVAGPVAAAGAFAVAFAVAIAIGVGAAAPGAAAVALTVTSAGAVIGAASVASAVALAAISAGALDWANRKRRFVPTIWVAYLMAVALAVAAGLTLISAAAELEFLVLFLAILPLINGLYDYASLGLTRWTLYRGHDSGRHMRWAAIDLFGALGLFVLLTLTLVAVLHGADRIAADGLLDMGDLLRDIRAAPGDYPWLWFVLLSTLLPTLAHLLLAAYALGEGLPPPRAARHLAQEIRLIRGEHTRHYRPVMFWLTVWRTLGISLALGALGLLGWLGWLILPPVADAMRVAVELFAASLGVEIVPERHVWANG
ncbi:hypothetical protein [Roseobacter sp. HKCCA0434]|uniref:hypothetical protein n=1 Tax=Roseobacter sp. HKCCA0434 TaxID=3079297 RepID=UPI002905CF7F|nr:hypothetical protein [Roseobacter sp. HKCCA0434]